MSIPDDVQQLIAELRSTAKVHPLDANLDICNEAADALEAQLQRAREREGEAVPENLDVRKIMLRVDPGDGSGLEVYATCVADVENLLTDIGGKLEDYELGITKTMTTPQLAKPEVREALRNLVDQLELIHESEEFKGVWLYVANHGMPYKGPTYEKQLVEAKQALIEPKDEQEGGT